MSQPCNLNVTLSKTNPTCYGDCNGMVSANVTGGSGNYTYMWSNGATTASIMNLCAGTYAVTVMDGNCTDSASTMIQKGRVGGNVVVTNATGCGACDGSMSATGNGGNGGPYTFMWSNGATTSMIDSLCPGTYTVTITDDEGCTFVCAKTVHGAGSFNVNQTIKHDTSCVGTSCSGSITVSPSVGPASNYTYMWNTGATTAMISALCAGNYTVTVSNGAGCSVTETYMVADSSNCGGCNLGITIARTHPTCHGDCDGSMTANVTNGTGAYTYMWSNGATTRTINNLCAGTYTVTATDANQCTVTMSQSISKGMVGANLVKHNPTCGQCNGSLTVNGNGGNGAPYTYLWSTGATTNMIDSLCPGTYTATITDDEGCTFICITTIVNDTTGCNGCSNDFTTYTQGGWGNTGAPGQYMAAHFATCFPNGVTIGDSMCGNSITLTSVQAVRDFLPQGGTPAALTQSYVDPGAMNITVLAGQLLAAHFALGFDACDTAFSGSSNAINEVIYVGDTASPFYGWSIQTIHDTAMYILAGCGSAYTPSDVNAALTAFNENYDNGGDMGWYVCPDDFGPVATVKPPITIGNAYPTPFRDKVTVDLKERTGITITVSELNGKVLYKFTNASGLYEINGKFQKGMYLITLEDPRTGERQLIRTISAF